MHESIQNPRTLGHPLAWPETHKHGRREPPDPFLPSESTRTVSSYIRRWPFANQSLGGNSHAKGLLDVPNRLPLQFQRLLQDLPFEHHHVLVPILDLLAAPGAEEGVLVLE